MKLGDIVKQYRTETKISMEKFAKLANVSKGYISMLENNKNPKTKKPISPSLETIQNIAEAMNMDFEILISKLDDNQVIKINQTPTSPSNNQAKLLLSNYQQLNDNRKNKLVQTSEQLLAEEKSKVIDITEKRAAYDSRKRISLAAPGKVSAGTGYWQEDDYDTMVDFYEDDIPNDSEYDTIAIVVGHSMEPKIKNGDFLFIKLTNQVDLNQIGIFRVDGENYVKKLKSDRLESLNKDYDDILLTEEKDVRTIGEVVDIYRQS